MEEVRTLRVGVVGAGLVAQLVHLPLLRALPGFAPVALAEPSRALREAVGARWAVPALDADHRALLRRELDALIVCSPNGTHVDVVLDALAAGVHVLVEKPLCLDPADADRIAAARDRARRVVQVGYMKRFDPAVEALLAAVEAPVRHAASLTHDPGLRRHFLPAGLPAGNDVPPAVQDALARRTAEQVAAATGSDGPEAARVFSEVFAGALVHDVNLGLAALDVGRVVDGFGDARAAGGTVELAGGARWTLAWLLNDALADFRQSFTVHTADGMHELTFPAPYVLGQPTTYTALAAGVRRTATSWREGYARQLEHFHACVTAGVACRTPVEQARRDLELLVELHRAATA